LFYSYARSVEHDLIGMTPLLKTQTPMRWVKSRATKKYTTTNHFYIRDHFINHYMIHEMSVGESKNMGVDELNLN
jgi:hypothetical protein